MNEPKRSIDAWGIGFAYIQRAQQERDRMTPTRVVLSVITAAAVVLTVAAGAVTWPL